jgi:hypothetical protein
MPIPSPSPRCCSPLIRLVTGSARAARMSTGWRCSRWHPSPAASRRAPACNLTLYGALLDRSNGAAGGSQTVRFRICEIRSEVSGYAAALAWSGFIDQAGWRSLALRQRRRQVPRSTSCAGVDRNTVSGVVRCLDGLAARAPMKADDTPNTGTDGWATGQR